MHPGVPISHLCRVALDSFRQAEHYCCRELVTVVARAAASPQRAADRASPSPEYAVRSYHSRFFNMGVQLPEELPVYVVILERLTVATGFVCGRLPWPATLR